MRLRQLFEAPQGKTAVVAFGRMNPPTIGHAKLVDTVKSLPGDPYIFLSQTQKPKTDPLPFADKLRYAKFFFPEITIGNPEVRTPIQMMQKLQALGYTDIIYVAGSDRVASFEKLFNDYNGKDYNFNSIRVVSAGERDPDAEGVEGMSASKLKKLAAEGKLEDWTDENGKKQLGFRSGVPRPEIADEMFAAVRQGMGIRDKEAVPAESIEEQTYDPNKLIAVVNLDGEAQEFDLTGRFQGDTRTQIRQAESFLNNFLSKKQIPSWSMKVHYQGVVSTSTASGPDISDLDSIANQARQRLGK